MRDSLWRSGAIITGLLLVIGMGILTLWNGVTPPSQAITAEEVTDDQPSVSPRELLTIEWSDFAAPERAQCVDDSVAPAALYFINQDASGIESLPWSDSYATGMKANKKADMLDEALAENCGNPTALDATVQGLARALDRAFDFDLLEANPWLDEFRSSVKADGLNQFVGMWSDTGAYGTTDDYRQVAAAVNTLLLRWHNAGVVEQATVANWYLPSHGMVFGVLPQAEPRPTQEDLPSLKLTLDEKGNGCVAAIGYNVSDKRFEILDCVTPKPAQEKPAAQKVTPQKEKPTARQPAPKPKTPRNPTPSGTTPPSTTPPSTPPTTPPPTSPPTTNSPKPSDPGEYKQPGDGSERDSGIGTKPTVTTTAPADSAPRPVKTKSPSNSGVTDAPTRQPSSESGVTAPGATPMPSSPPPAPAPEPSVNPTTSSNDNDEPPANEEEVDSPF